MKDALIPMTLGWVLSTWVPVPGVVSRMARAVVHAAVAASGAAYHAALGAAAPTATGRGGTLHEK